DALNVRAICDLRRTDERTREPTVWRSASTRALYWDDGAQPPTIRAIATRHPNTASGMHAAMCDLYRALPDWMAPRMRDLFAHLAEDATPIIVHCAAGKDRTGVAIALLLAALDVPYESILADYLATNRAGDFEQFILTRQRSQLGLAVDHHPLLALPNDVRQVLFAADAAYLAAAFDHIDKHCGGLANFLREHAGLSEQRHQQLRSTLLVNVP
ncbi:MAG TPA: tyrosine-protein phosphatase, partial [Roseiflexaceae bacterium]|nr:tyrosine-protein phosphatase [Roseiflexaceae bacterium]